MSEGTKEQKRPDQALLKTRGEAAVPTFVRPGRQRGLQGAQVTIIPCPFPDDMRQGGGLFLGTKIALTSNHPPIHPLLLASQSSRHLIICLQIKQSMGPSIPISIHQPNVHESTRQHITNDLFIHQPCKTHMVEQGQVMKGSWARG